MGWPCLCFSLNFCVIMVSLLFLFLLVTLLTPRCYCGCGCGWCSCRASHRAWTVWRQVCGLRSEVGAPAGELPGAAGVSIPAAKSKKRGPGRPTGAHRGLCGKRVGADQDGTGPSGPSLARSLSSLPLGWPLPCSRLEVWRLGLGPCWVPAGSLLGWAGPDLAGLVDRFQACLAVWLHQLPHYLLRY